MRKLVLATAGMLAALAQTSAEAAETAKEGPDHSMVRIKAAGLGTDDWLGGRFVHAQGCTMVKLDRPSPNRYTSLLLVGISHLQVNKAGQWADIAIPPMLKSEPAHCRVAGSD
jgi:hypothetical protein